MKVSIFQTPGGLYSITIFPQLPEEVEEKKVYEIANVLLSRFNCKLKMNSMGLGNFIKLEDPDGLDVYVALDHWFGLSVDSKNLKFIEEIKELLENELLVDYFPSV